MPALVVAIAGYPSSSNTRALATSQALGSTNMRGPLCNFLSSSAFRPCAAVFMKAPFGVWRSGLPAAGGPPLSRSEPPRRFKISVQQLQHLIVNLPIGTKKISGINRALAAHIARPPARFFHNNPQRRQVPRLRRPVQCRLSSSFGHQHVLPESTKSAPAASRIGKAPNLFLSQFVFTWSGAGGEHHCFTQLGHTRNVNPFPVAISAFAAIRPPATRQSRSAGHSRHNFAIALDSQQRSKRLNPARKFLRAVDRIDDQSRLRGTWRLALRTTHLFAEHIQREAAGRHFCASHLLYRAICLRYGRPIALSVHAHSVRAKIFHSDYIRVLRNILQQRPILRSIAHHLPCVRLAKCSLTKSARDP